MPVGGTSNSDVGSLGEMFRQKIEKHMDGESRRKCLRWGDQHVQRPGGESKVCSNI